MPIAVSDGTMAATVPATSIEVTVLLAMTTVFVLVELIPLARPLTPEVVMLME